MIEIDKDWHPAYDEDGNAIPITYAFNATDAQEGSVEGEHEFESSKPADETVLRREATLFARRVTQNHPEAHPWSNWRIDVGAHDLYDDGPAQVTSYFVTDLLQK